MLVYGHYDVQPPAPLELWESEPFVAEPRGEWLYARGVADDKGQLWMQLKAIEELVARRTLPVTFRVVCDGEEETGGDAIIRFLERDDGPVDACVVLDGWMKTRNTPEFVVGDAWARRARHRGADGRPRPPLRPLRRHGAQRDPRALQALTALFPRDGRLPEPLRAGVTSAERGRGRGLARCRRARRSSHVSGRCRWTTRRRGVLRARLRRAVARRHRDPRRQARPPEHDARLARGRGITIRVAPGQDPAVLAVPRRRSSATRSRRRLARGRDGDLTPPAVLPRDTEAPRARAGRVRGRVRPPAADRARRAARSRSLRRSRPAGSRR